MGDRIGVFGGSFDPVHLGHLIVAEQCREQCRLDRVLFVPAAVPPHKVDRQLAPGSHRLEMLRLATAGHEQFEVSSIELDREGPSYTVVTLEQLRTQFPDAELWLIVGADMLRDFPTWREPKRILELARIAACNRPGTALEIPAGVPLGFIEQLRDRVDLVHVPEIGISASDIRSRIRSGRSVRFLVPRAVECYISEHGLYRD